MTPEQKVLYGRFRSAMRSHRDRTNVGLLTIWDRLGAHDEADVATFARSATPILAGAKQISVATSAAFYSYILDLPRPPAVTAADVVLDPDLRRPFAAYWHGLAEGRPFADALGAGRSVAGHTGSDYLTSVSRRTGDAVAKTAGVETRWMRVAGPDACPWCMERDGGIYATAEDGDFGHERDACDMVPTT